MKAIEYWKVECEGKNYIYLMDSQHIIELDYLILSPKQIEEIITEVLNDREEENMV